LGGELLGGLLDELLEGLGGELLGGLEDELLDELLERLDEDDEPLEE